MCERCVGEGCEYVKGGGSECACMVGEWVSTFHLSLHTPSPS